MGPNNVLHEKGIDVWLALEAYEMAINRKFDIIVLVVCDGDYVPLVRKLNTLGAHSMLISWDFDYYNENGKIESTRTSQQLVEEVYHPVSMNQIIDGGEQDLYSRNLFVLDKDNFFVVASVLDNKNSANRRGGQEETPAEDAEYGDAFNSVILSVKEGYGFIEDHSVNNVFFHYSNVENADFNDLKPGMKVRYFREEDIEQSKITESPRFKATKVIVMS
jgi:cold shock CspA family protein